MPQKQLLEDDNVKSKNGNILVDTRQSKARKMGYSRILVGKMWLFGFQQLRAAAQ